MLIVRNTGHRAFEGKALSQTELDHLLDNLEKIRGLPAWGRKQQRLAEERKQEQQRLAEERREADEKAKQEQQRLAEAGDLEAQYQLGILYSGSNAYIEQDLAQAFKWFEKSADQGHTNA